MRKAISALSISEQKIDASKICQRICTSRFGLKVLEISKSVEVAYLAITFFQHQGLLFSVFVIESCQTTHYENLPMQYIEKILVVKLKLFIGNFFILFLFLLKT